MCCLNLLLIYGNNFFLSAEKIMKFLVTVLIFFMFSISNASKVVEHAEENDELSVAFKHKIALMDSVFENSFPKLSADYEIPYIGKTLKIGGKKFTASEIIDISKDVSGKILLALKKRIIENGYAENGFSIQYDSTCVKNVLDSLKSAVDFEKEQKKYAYLSALEIKDSLITRCFEKNLDKPLDGNVPSSVDDCYLMIDFLLKTEKRKIAFSFKTFETEVINKISFVIERYWDDENPVVVTKFNSFTMEMPGITSQKTEKYDLPIRVKKDDCLKISITKEGFRDNVELDNFVNRYYDGLSYYRKYLKIWNETSIPFFEKNFNDLVFSWSGLNLKDFIGVVDDYCYLLQFVLDYSINDDSYIDLEGVSKYLYNLNVTIPLNSLDLKILADKDDNSTDENFVNLLKPATLSTVNWLRLQKGENIILFKVSLKMPNYAPENNPLQLNVAKQEAEINAYIKYGVYVTKNRDIVLLDMWLDEVDLRWRAEVPEINLGAYKAKFGGGPKGKNGILYYCLVLKPDSSNTVATLYPSIKLSYDKVSLMMGDSVIKTLNHCQLPIFRTDLKYTKSPCSCQPILHRSKII